MTPSRETVFITGASGFIGTNLIHSLIADGIPVINYDKTAPLDETLMPFWVEGNIRDADTLQRALIDARPQYVIHLAARTDCVETITVEEGYRDNTDGTQNVLDAIACDPEIEHAIITSSQYVVGPQHGLPKHDEDYGPHTVYGHSKVITEQLTRAATLPCPWTLVRPANIWGPWHMRYRSEFWRIAAKGLYMHPGRAPVVRTYGYVGNVVAQLRAILAAEREKVDGKTFYVGDLPDDIFGWTDAFCRALTGKPARVVPRFILRTLGWTGDVAKRVGLPFPITSSRFQNMIGAYPTPMQETWDVLGTPPYSLEEGVAATVDWLNSYNATHGNP